MVSTNKQSTVASFAETLQKHSNFVLVTFDKTTHQSLETLRKALKKEQASIAVIKNTLFEKAINKLAIKNKGIKEFKTKFFPLKGTTAILALGDSWDKGLHAFNDFLKKDKTLGFKFGILDKENYDAAGLQKIAALPGKDALMAAIIGSMKSPAAKLLYGMKYNVQKFVYILNQKSKGGESK